MKYAFVIGRNPELSIAELGCFFDDLEVAKIAPVAFTKKELPSPPQQFLNRLGGCMEIIELFGSHFPAADVSFAIEKYLVETCGKMRGKCNFALNLLPEKKASKTLKLFLTSMKKNLHAGGFKANFMNKDFNNVSLVFAWKQHLAPAGTNINIIDEGEGKISLGYSVALQDFEAYSKRDYGKPFRNPQAGMLPPKLAQIMINIAERGTRNAERIIIDPFCGTGTILTEALLMGYSVIGSDSDARMVEGCNRNIEWLRKNFKISEKVTSEVSQKNAETAAYHIPHTTYSIVTEPYLGPPLSRFPAEAFLKKLMDELSIEYINFFTHLRKMISPKTLVVCIFPYFRKSARESVKLSDMLIEKIEKLGYSKTTFPPLKSSSLFYERPDQTVGREIIRFVV